MAVEARRGCGYRKIGGLYLVSSGIALPCCKLPLLLHVCPTCSQGVKQTRGWTWIDPVKLFIGPTLAHTPDACADPARAPYCPAADLGAMGRAGLLWIGERFYPSPSHFVAESDSLGISRRLSALPRDLEIGKTWVFLAHPKACNVNGEWQAGVFRIFKPERVEKIVKQSDFDVIVTEQAARGIVSRQEFPVRADATPEVANVCKAFNADLRRGIIWVPVPDDDPDHKGTAYDDDAHEHTNGNGEGALFVHRGFDSGAP